MSKMYLFTYVEKMRGKNNGILRHDLLILLAYVHQLLEEGTV